LERECQDALEQLAEFENEKEDELRQIQSDSARLQRQLLEQEQDYQRRFQEMERERENLLEAMTEEGQELQTRIKKLNRDKETLSMDLAKALARVESASSEVGGEAGERPPSAQNLADLRKVQDKCESLKDEVTSKDGQIVLLGSKLEIAFRKLRLADMENTMLKSEIEVLRKNTGGGKTGEGRVIAIQRLELSKDGSMTVSFQGQAGDELGRTSCEPGRSVGWLREQIARTLQASPSELRLLGPGGKLLFDDVQSLTSALASFS
jgi:DNA repair exonuclease SbcCD ATPase subunit